ncbi:uncharacterized protein LOC142564507 [Dermacentor variabilis]|uniref:uncharacterized protein LOC142564507 n=1 Tax=Dermacentor variabilis TaxID=34621 RepID=UPI003F5B6052
MVIAGAAGSDLSIIDIDSVTIDNAELGQEVAVDARIQVLRSFGSYPVLEIYVNTTKGKQLECFYSYLPKEARLCYVTTAVEAKLSSEWNNSCPISPGGYTAHLVFKLPNVPSAESCIGNGDLVFTLKIRDEGYVLDCVTFPVKIDRR